MYQIFSCSSTSFSDNGTKCGAFAILDEGLHELKSWLYTPESKSLACVACQPPAAGVDQPSVAPSSCLPGAPEQLYNQGGWVTSASLSPKTSGHIMKVHRSERDLQFYNKQKCELICSDPNLSISGIIFQKCDRGQKYSFIIYSFAVFA